MWFFCLLGFIPWESSDQASAAANAALPVGVSTAQERKKRAAVPEEAAVPANRSVPASARSIDGGSSGVPSAPDDDGFLAPEQLRAAHLGGAGGPAGGSPALPCQGGRGGDMVLQTWPPPLLVEVLPPLIDLVPPLLKKFPLRGHSIFNF